MLTILSCIIIMSLDSILTQPQYLGNILVWDGDKINGLVQERRNSIANALELPLSCTNPSRWCIPHSHLQPPARPIIWVSTGNELIFCGELNDCPGEWLYMWLDILLYMPQSEVYYYLTYNIMVCVQSVTQNIMFTNIYYSDTSMIHILTIWW